MTQCPALLKEFTNQLREIWTPGRLATLSRISLHRRQFEGWWKFELATYLWDFASTCNAKVFVEAYDRADIVLATPRLVKFETQVNVDGPICVPVALKTLGTWWGRCDSAISKAMEEPGKRRLVVDFQELAKRRRTCLPFGAVALLVTDAEGDAAVLDAYEKHASQLAKRFDLCEVMNHRLTLPPILQEVQQCSARQLVWASW